MFKVWLTVSSCCSLLLNIRKSFAPPVTYCLSKEHAYNHGVGEESFRNLWKPASRRTSASRSTKMVSSHDFIRPPHTCSSTHFSFSVTLRHCLLP